MSKCWTVATVILLGLVASAWTWQVDCYEKPNYQGAKEPLYGTNDHSNCRDLHNPLVAGRVSSYKFVGPVEWIVTYPLTRCRGTWLTQGTSNYPKFEGAKAGANDKIRSIVWDGMSGGKCWTTVILVGLVSHVLTWQVDYYEKPNYQGAKEPLYGTKDHSNCRDLHHPLVAGRVSSYKFVGPAEWIITYPETRCRGTWLTQGNEPYAKFEGAMAPVNDKIRSMAYDGLPPNH